VTAFEILPNAPVRARLRAPASKSVTNRLLVVAALAEGESRLRGPLASDDTHAMRDAVTALGAAVEDRADGWLVRGTGGRLTAPAAPIDARLSGTTMRFVTALAALADGRVTVTGRAPLLRRPMEPLAAALRALEAGGPVEVDVSQSSQFATAVLLVAPYAGKPVTVHAVGEAADGYIDLTVDLMRRWGAEVRRCGPMCWQVAPGRYRARDEVVEPDASAAAHLFALAAATAGEITVSGAVLASAQPDSGVPDLLELMGCEVGRGGDDLTVTGPERLRPLDADLSEMPDQVTTLASLGALAEGTSRLRGVAVTRGHETDRLAALAGELRRLGVAVTERPDGLDVTGGGARGPARLGTHDDHRLAMAFAAIAARVPGVAIEEPWCVTKSYPGFWTHLRRAGLEWATRP
jgi:3-phosphoshikimate 1-carboxyvinyltransferase